MPMMQTRAKESDSRNRNFRAGRSNFLPSHDSQNRGVVVPLGQSSVASKHKLHHPDEDNRTWEQRQMAEQIQVRLRSIRDDAPSLTPLRLSSGASLDEAARFGWDIFFSAF